MEAHLVQALEADEELQAFFEEREPADWLYGASSPGIGPNEEVPERPYIIWNELPGIPYFTVDETSDAQMRTFQIYVYDYRGDFTRINAILRVIRRIVKELAPFTDAEGTRCSESKWVAISGNVVDDGYDSCCRYGTARFTVSQ